MYIRTVPKEIKDMLKGIADKTGHPYSLIEDVYFHQFFFIAEAIRSGEKGDYGTYNNILVKHLGSFIANEKHVNKLIEIANAKKENNIEDSAGRSMGLSDSDGEGIDTA